MGRRLPYGITHCYLLPGTSECAPPNLSHAGWYLIYLPRRDGRLSWPSWLDSAPAGSRSSNLSITSPTPNHCTKAPRQKNHESQVPREEQIPKTHIWVCIFAVLTSANANRHFLRPSLRCPRWSFLSGRQKHCRYTPEESTWWHHPDCRLFFPFAERAADDRYILGLLCWFRIDYLSTCERSLSESFSTVRRRTRYLAESPRHLQSVMIMKLRAYAVHSHVQWRI